MSVEKLKEKIKSGQISPQSEEIIACLYLIITLLAFQNHITWLFWVSLVITIKNCITTFWVGWLSAK